MSKFLILSGVVLILAGVLWHFNLFTKFPLGRLPGDFHFKIGGADVFMPLATSLLLSALLSLLFYLFSSK